MALYVVLREFNSDEVKLPGEVVDVDGWRWTRHLVETRYLAPFHGSPVKSQNGRLWENMEAAKEGTKMLKEMA